MASVGFMDRLNLDTPDINILKVFSLRKYPVNTTTKRSTNSIFWVLAYKYCVTYNLFFLTGRFKELKIYILVFVEIP